MDASKTLQKVKALQERGYCVGLFSVQELLGLVDGKIHRCHHDLYIGDQTSLKLEWALSQEPSW